MDDTRFDALVREVSAAATRRRLLGGLLGGAAVLSGAVVGVGDSLAKRGKGKKKGHGKNNGNGNGNGKGRTKVTLCHKGHLITVGAPAVKAHEKHGDVVCEAGACQTGDPTGCDDAGCTFDLAAEGTECTTDDGAAGTCDAAGVCVATPVCGGEGASCELNEDCCDGFSCESGICTAV